MTCRHKSCLPFHRVTVRLDRGLTLRTVCKDRQEVDDCGRTTGLTVSWKVGGWTLTDRAGLVLASGGLHPKRGFVAHVGGSQVRGTDQHALIGRVALKVLAVPAETRVAA